MRKLRAGLQSICLCLLLSLPAFAQKSVVIGNATEWRDFLAQGRLVADLRPLVLDRGCGPSGCVIDVGEYTLDRDQGQIRSTDGHVISLKHFPTAAALPELDWEPLAAYEVRRGGMSWGVCMDMQHAGIGKSGSFQRWKSVVLLPKNSIHWQGFRFVGYWIDCSSLSSPDEQGLLELGVLRAGGGRMDMELLWYHCTSSACQPRRDARRRIRASSSPGGGLEATKATQPPPKAPGRAPPQ